MSKDLGRVIPLPRGQYDASREYDVLDMAYDNTGAYMCMSECVGVPLTDAEHWKVIIDLTPITNALSKPLALDEANLDFARLE